MPDPETAELAAKLRARAAKRRDTLPAVKAVPAMVEMYEAEIADLEAAASLLSRLVPPGEVVVAAERILDGNPPSDYDPDDDGQTLAHYILGRSPTQEATR